jgi:diguanylate cyclase (GGDEF)-like protein
VLQATRKLRGWLAGLALACMASTAAAVVVPERAPGFLLAGAPSAEQTPMRACAPQMREGLRERRIEAPPGGWPGAPQAINVFNVFTGEVMVALGEREVCGRMHDARTRDSRFRASVGMVAVPRAGSREPIRVAWEEPLQSSWQPTVVLGAPSPVQQMDTMRLLVRVSCMAIGLALAMSALMGFVGTRDRSFIRHAAVCVVLVAGQAILSGLSGYPRPWLPVGTHEAWWLTAATAIAVAALAHGVWQQSGVAGAHPLPRRAVTLLVRAAIIAALLVPALPLASLRWTLLGLELAFCAACLGLLAVASLSLRRGDRSAMLGLVSIVPFLAIIAGEVASSRLLIAYRIEVLQLAVTWFLIAMGYALTRRYSHLRRQHDAMRVLAATDELTGLPNRRSGLARLERLFGQSRERGEPLTVGFVDIDRFKRINDVYGHEVGDRVLAVVAQALAGAMRGREDVVRMGGEEFLVVMPNVGLADAAPRLERMRERVRQAGASLGIEGLHVTASIGLASLRHDDEDPASLLRRADGAMYRAKQAGRDRVLLAGS